MTTKSNRNGVFHRLVEKFAKGDETREMYLWDICYRYEVYFCLFITILLMIPFLWGGPNPLFLMLPPWVLAMVTIMPLYEGWSDRSVIIPSKRENIGQFRFAFANFLGLAGMAVMLAGPFLFYYNHRNYSDIKVIASVGVVCVVWYLIMAMAYVFVNDYVKWRFNWAVKNYEMLWSRHYRWWTSGIDYEVQKINMVIFRAYKVFAGTFLLAGPLCMFVGYYLCKWMGI